MKYNIREKEVIKLLPKKQSGGTSYDFQKEATLPEARRGKEWQKIGQLETAAEVEQRITTLLREMAIHQAISDVSPRKQLSFKEVFAKARKERLAGGSKTFQWTNPKTGKTMTYGTDLATEVTAKATPQQSQPVQLPEVTIKADVTKTPDSISFVPSYNPNLDIQGVANTLVAFHPPKMSSFHERQRQAEIKARQLVAKKEVVKVPNKEPARLTKVNPSQKDAKVPVLETRTLPEVEVTATRSTPTPKPSPVKPYIPPANSYTPVSMPKSKPVPTLTYIPPTTFKVVEDYKTPNIRGPEDSSYKAGHPLKNEKRAIILHHTDGSAQSALNTFLEADTAEPVSAHMIVGEDGTIYKLASPNDVTFHAGVSEWKGRPNVNDFGIGIEFEGNTLKSPLTEQQIQSAVEQMIPIMLQNGINWDDVTSHAKITKNNRKPDITDRELQRVKHALATTIWGNKEWRDLYFRQHYQ